VANHKSAIKRARQNECRRLRNKGYKTKVKNAIKGVRAAVADGSVEQAEERFACAVSIIQKTASKGVIHRRNGSRRISRLARSVNNLIAINSQ